MPVYGRCYSKVLPFIQKLGKQDTVKITTWSNIIDRPPGLPLSGWAEIRQWTYNTQRPLYKDEDTSPSLVLTGSLGLIDGCYRDREIGVYPVGPTLAAAWG